MIRAELVGGPEDGRRIELDAPVRTFEMYEPASERRVDVLGSGEPVPVGYAFVTYRLRYCRDGVHYYDHPNLRR